MADESVDRHVVDLLRVNGFSVLYIAEMLHGISDIEVLTISNKNKAVLITADKDFGELVYRQQRLTHGVIILRLAGLSPVKKSEITFTAIRDHYDEIYNAFSVIMPNAIRIRHKMGLPARGK